MQGGEMLGLAVLGLIVGGLSIWIWRNGSRSPLLLAVGALPFTEVPTIKAFARWRLTEVLLGLLLLHAIVARRDDLRIVFRSLPRSARIGAASLLVFVTYTWVVGLVRAAVTPELSETQIVQDYLIAPVLRPTLEGARMLAVFTLLLLLLVEFRGPADLRRILSVFCIGLAASAAYGWYQAAAFRLDLPLLAGTFQQANARPGSTLFEPTAFSSLMAVGSFLAVARAWVDTDEPRASWLANGGFAAATSQFVVSIAGTIAGVAGSLVAMATSSKRRLKRNAVTVTALAALAVVGLGFGALNLGTMYVQTVYASWSLERDVDARLSLGRRNEGGEKSESGGESLGGQQGDATSDRMDARTALRTYEPISLLVGLGQGNALMFVGGVTGGARLVLESGLPGFVSLGLFHASVLMAVWRMVRKRLGWQLSVLPFVVAAYGAVSLVTLNYMNTSDAWLWLPAFLLLWMAASGGLKTSSEEEPTRVQAADPWV